MRIEVTLKGGFVYKAELSKAVWERDGLYYMEIVGRQTELKAITASIVSRNSPIKDVKIVSEKGETEGKFYNLYEHFSIVKGWGPFAIHRENTTVKNAAGKNRKAYMVAISREEPGVFSYTDENELLDGVYRSLDRMSDYPIPRDETVEILRELRESGELSSYVTEMDQVGFKTRFAKLNYYQVSDLIDEIYRRLGIDKTNVETRSLADFLRENKKTLKERTKRILKPIYEYKTGGEEKKELLTLPRKPLEAQIDPIIAVHKGLQKRKGIFLVGEMGCGKTYISIAASCLQKMKAKKVAVMVPPHLVEKWKREIRAVEPDATIIDTRNMSISDIVKTRDLDAGKIYWVIGREQAKRHYGKRMINFMKRVGRDACPICGEVIQEEDEKKVLRTRKCPYCGSPLETADRSGQRQYAVSLLMRKKHFRFDLLVADEVHELKGGSTAQGLALANLASISKHRLALTGTLMGGYASNLFYLFWRIAPNTMRKLGFTYKSISDFVEKYGILETVETVVEDDENIHSIRKRKKVRIKEKPGISPELVLPLLEHAVFVKLSDIAKDLPNYNEEIINVQMSEAQKERYDTLFSKLYDALIKALKKGSKKLLGAYVNSLYAYPDGARRGETVIDPITDKVVVSIPPLDEDILPKERELLRIARREKERGRKVLVYLEHTGTRDLIPDLKDRLEEEGLRVAVLRSNTVSTAKREAWIREKAKDIDVLITNPRIVQTGLDLYEFPTIVFFQTGYSVFTLRQASRRSWRIGQGKPIEVYYLVYGDTAQERALTLMASKLQTALLVEGDLSDKGLTELSESESSFIVELAKSMLDNKESTNLKAEWEDTVKTEMETESFIGDDVFTDTEEVRISTTTQKTITVGGKKRTVKYTIVSHVKISGKQASLSYNNNEYLLKDGVIIDAKTNETVGRYLWRKGKKGKYADCLIGNDRIFIGKSGDSYIALKKCS